MLQNAYFLAKIGADTAESERNFAEMLPKIGNYPTGPPGGGYYGGSTEANMMQEVYLALNEEYYRGVPKKRHTSQK